MPVRILNNNGKIARQRAGTATVLAAAPRDAAEMLFDLPKPPAGYAQLPAGLSLCMIVKDEERFLQACLASIAPIVDEICIFDTGSSDRTVEIAKSFGATVRLGEWRSDFSWARNQALDMATRRWIIMLDADEVLRSESIAPLRALREVPAHLTGVWLRCHSASDDYKGTGSMSNAIVRIYPNNPRIRYRNPIHEFITIDGALTGMDARTSSIAIDHYGYTSEMIVAREKGKRNLAIAKAATESSPHDAFNWSNYGLTAYITGDADTAIMALEKMRDLVGNEPRGFVPNSLATLADVYCEVRKDYEKALYIASECLKRAPHFANAHFMLGKAYARMQRWDDARTAYKAAVDDAAYNHLQFVVDDEVPLWKAPSEIGVCYIYEGCYEEALEWFEKGLVNRPNAQPLRLNRLKALESLQRYEETSREFAALWSQYKDDATAVPYVNFLLRRRQNEMALVIIDEAVESVSTSCKVSLLQTAAMICNELKMSDRVEHYMRRVLEYAPANAQALSTLESMYESRSERDKLETLRRIEFDAECVAPGDFVRRASRLLAMGEAGRARDAALAGLAIAPSDARLLYNAGAAEVRLGDLAAAIEHLQGIGREDAEVFKTGTYLRALLLSQVGDFVRALEATDTLLALEPAHFDVLLLRAKCLDSLGRPDAAERVLRMLPRHDQRVAIELAGLLMRMGRAQEAQAVADAALARA